MIAATVKTRCFSNPTAKSQTKRVVFHVKLGVPIDSKIILVVFSQTLLSLITLQVLDCRRCRVLVFFLVALVNASANDLDRVERHRYKFSDSGSGIEGRFAGSFL